MISSNILPLCLNILVVICPGEQPWARHTIDDSSQGADGVRLADVNDDGLMDITVGWEEGGVVRVYLHPGHVHAKGRWPSVTVGEVKSAEDAVFVDLDADGAVDVVSSCEGKTRTVFAHWAPESSGNYLKPKEWQTEAFPSTLRKQSWMYALPMQIDGDHGMDLVVSSKGSAGSVGWLQSPQDLAHLSQWKYHRLQDAGWIMSLIPLDMDDDGDQDILVSDRKGARRGIYWLERPKSTRIKQGAAWVRHNVGGGDREIMFLSVGDVDRDGGQDIIAIDRKEIVWFRATSPDWEQHAIPLPDGVGTGKSAAVGDINSDGQTDIVFSCENAKGELSGMRWLSWGQSATAGRWISHEIGGPLGLKYDRVVLHDVDGDGDLDVLCCEERDQLGVFWYENPFPVN